MSQRPVVDDRDREALYTELRELAAQYTESWDPSTDDNATVLLRIFSQLGEDVIRRLNDVPAKHRLAFLDALGFDRRPPQAARLPVTFEVSTDIDRNVAIPGGTQAAAEPSDGPTQLFELPQDGGFEATGASLTDVIAVDPSADRIVDHSELRTGDDPVELFSGENVQEHVLYLAHDDLLTLEAGSPLTITAETTVDRSVLETELVWEYYGEADDGTVGWQPLEPWSCHTSGDDEPGLDTLQKRLQSGSSSRVDDDQVELRFRLPGETVRHTIDGVESRWLRCRIAGGGSLSEPFSMRLQSISASVGRDTREDGLAPDRLLSNDVPLSTDEGDVRPLGRLPHPPSTFYVASEEAFTKRDGIVEVQFEPPANPDADGIDTVADPDATEEVTVGANEHDGDVSPTQGVGVLDGPPELSWEYWTGSGWSRLPVLTDETNDLRTAGRVRFSVPTDIEPTAVSGHENVWIRARLVRGNYGQPSFDITDAGAHGSLGNSPDSPRFGGVSIHYDCDRQSFETIRMKNNASIRSVSPERDGPLTPFVQLPDETQTLYLGFDETLRDGPLSIFVPIEDSTYPRSFDPGMRWEYCVDPDERDWSKLTVQDRTGGLTERGMVRLTFPEPTTAFELFGRQRHWIRVRVTQDEFDRSLDADAQSVRSTGETDRLRHRATAPPTLEGLYPNTQWAFNTRTIEDEVLGSSDGSHDQSFACAHAPVIDIDVWVDEFETLSTSERRDLLAERPEDVRRVTDASGDVTEWWVRWQQVSDMLDSAPTDRHYVVDKIDGTVSFGDGNRGRIPPSGQKNITATYTTGGGRDGNVAADTITELTSSISLVEDVSNPKPADGGADTEPRDALVSRTTTQLKHRGRAVTPSDYEQVATAAFRELAKVACNPCGATDDGDIVLLIVPQTRREKPMPSMELEQRVRETVRERAPVSLVESDASRIVVRGPTYAEVSVSVTLSMADTTSISLLKTAVERRLDEFLHPLDGNGGEGWSFGAKPSVDALIDVVTDTKHVDAVNDLGVTVEVDGDVTSRSGREAVASLPPDALVCSGTHEVIVSMTGGEHS
ncbi:putative phage baseplate assembly protein [Natrinema hispanicum]|uniref:Putative phage baseplate assembly protein n=1 Tax=Natrinema hispanicum TaxID=392421 RepID=A0A482YC75_9EURY|nr:putative baseplate assembly protein [Natrinema hispanicum]RZV11807.1 putative phage baseplate assembly protein [Natrinema hispanicum]